MKIEFGKSANLKNIVYILTEKEIGKPNLELIQNKLHRNIIEKMIKSETLKGDVYSTSSSFVDNDNYDKIIVISSGDPSKISNEVITKVGGAILIALTSHKVSNADILVSHNLTEEQIAYIAYGTSLRDYSFDHYKSKEKLKNSFTVEKLNFICQEPKNSSSAFSQLEPVVRGIHFARDLISEPPNILYPESYAEKCKVLEKSGIKVEILDETAMQKLGMNTLLGVGQGSSKPSRMVVMQYLGAKDKKAQPIAFVGKGVTFDTGGISLKPGGGMEDMKYDMAGSAAVVGTMMALAERKANVNVIGVIGLVENMPGGNAQRPADVVKSMSGQTVEVINTDAEGRLVLADALWYTQDRFKPKFMINLATLTGAIIIALGNTYAGLFSNDDKLADNLYNTGLEVDEKLWRFPLHKDYDKDIDSDIADVRNLAKTERNAGSIAAAQFLQRFVNNTAWAHLDIAGVAWDKKGNYFCPKGAVGFGVKLLNELVKKYYED